MDDDINNNQKTKLLVLTCGFPKWKNDHTDPFVYELSKNLAGDFNIYVLNYYSKGSSTYECMDNMEINRFKYWFDEKKNLTDGAILANLKKNKFLWIQVPFFLILGFVSLIKLVKNHKIKIIHAHWIVPSGLLAVLYKKLFDKNVKVVITSHGGDIFGLRKFNFLKKWMINNCDGITVVSNAIKKEIKKLGIKNNILIEVIPMGIDTCLFSPDKYDESIKKKYGINGKFLLFVGRLSEKKGVKYLINAMPDILKEFPDTKLLIIGDGEDREHLERLAKELGLYGNSIIFTGALANHGLPKYYATADLFIGPSIISSSGDREGLPVSYMEALSSGCILFATDLEGNKDIIEDEINGIIIKQKDSKDISNKVIRLLKNKNLYYEIKKNTRPSVVDRFDWKVVSSQFKKILRP